MAAAMAPSTPVKFRLLPVLGMGLATALVVFSLLDFLGSYFAGRPDLASLQRATRLAPGNAAYHTELGRYLQVTNPDLRQARQEYETAARLNPNDSAAWFDIVRVQQVLGNAEAQSRALEQAVRAAPKKPEVAWESANFYLIRGDRDRAMSEFRIVLENDPPSVPAALDLLWRVQPDAGALLERAIPPIPSAYISFLGLLMAKQETQAAARVWSALLQLQQPLPPAIGPAYVTYLLGKRQAEAARQAWLQMAPLCGLTAYLPGQNLIVNPRFELPVLNAGFDWHYDQVRNVKINLEANSAPGGNQSLLVTFEGPAISGTGLSQAIALAPNSQYQFSVHFKSDEMEGAGGPAFVLRDALTGKEYFTTETLRNPGSWREVTAHFQTGADSQLAILQLNRFPAEKAVRGHLWLDEVQMVRLNL